MKWKSGKHIKSPRISMIQITENICLFLFFTPHPSPFFSDHWNLMLFIFGKILHVYYYEWGDRGSSLPVSLLVSQDRGPIFFIRTNLNSQQQQRS